MIIHDVPQGEPEWHDLRRAIPTASEFKNIIKSSGGYSIKGGKTYAYKLIFEIMSGTYVSGVNTTWMDRGKILEAEAIKQYAFENEVTVQRCGFITDDDYTMGCSPDGVVGEDGLIEVKCLSEANHIKNLLTDRITAEFLPQVQGQMLITERKWVDWYSYWPGLPVAEIRTRRDDRYINKLELCIKRFREEMSLIIEELQARGKWIQHVEGE